MKDGVQAIRHGMFIMPFHDPAKPLGQCYDEDLELIVRAEELGFSEFWIGEHHTRLPHPPIAVPAMSRNSSGMKMAGRRGYHPFGHCVVAAPGLADFWQTYEDGALEAGAW